MKSSLRKARCACHEDGMIKHAFTLALLATSGLALAEQEPAERPSPGEIVRSAPGSDWVAIPPEDLLVMTLAPDARGNPREVVIQLMPAPLSQGWVENIRTLAKAHWWDGLSIYRSVDNWVVQWGDGEEEEADRKRPAKPLPEGLNVVSENEYVQEFGPGMFGNILTEFGARPESSKQYPTVSGKSSSTNFSDAYSSAGAFFHGLPVAMTMKNWSEVAAYTVEPKNVWPTHCYASVGVARDLSPDTGTGAELYAVIGHAPRQLDRNIAVVGRVIEGIAHLSILPRGTGEYGVYETEEEHTPIISLRLGDETGEFPTPRFEYLDTSGNTFSRYVDALANREDEFYKVPAGGIDICNIRVPIRRIPSD